MLGDKIVARAFRHGKRRDGVQSLAPGRLAEAHESAASSSTSREMTGWRPPSRLCATSPARRYGIDAADLEPGQNRSRSEMLYHPRRADAASQDECLAGLLRRSAISPAGDQASGKGDETGRVSNGPSRTGRRSSRLLASIMQRSRYWRHLVQALGLALLGLGILILIEPSIAHCYLPRP